MYDILKEREEPLLKVRIVAHLIMDFGRTQASEQPKEEVTVKHSSICKLRAAVEHLEFAQDATRGC